MEPSENIGSETSSSAAGAETEQTMPLDVPQWFCLRTQPRHEAFAHGFLQKQEGVRSFFPRIQFRGSGRRRGQWIIEALFPGYLFCQFDWRRSARLVTYSPGITGLIHFGNHYPVIAPEVIQDLQSHFNPDEPTIVEKSLQIGDRVLIEAGPLRGNEGVVCRILPGKTRVALLLEFLGQQTQIEVDIDQLESPARKVAF